MILKNLTTQPKLGVTPTTKIYLGGTLVYEVTTLAYILYSSPFDYTLDANGNTLMTNKGTAPDATVTSGHGIELQVDNELPLPIANTGGTGSFITVVNGDGTVEQIGNIVDGGSSDNLELSVNSTTVINSSIYEGIAIEALIETPIEGASYRVEIVISDYISGEFSLYSSGAMTSGILHSGNGIVIINAIGNDATNVLMIFSTSFKGTLYIQSVKEILPTSTTYDLINQTVLEAMPTTKKLTTADLDLIRADTSLMTRLALGATDTNLSLGTADVFGHYAFMEKEAPLAFDDTSLLAGTSHFKSTDTAQVYTMRMPVGTSVFINDVEYVGNDDVNVVANISVNAIKIRESVDGCLTNFYCYENQLTGSIPNLSSNTSLTYFYCYTNQLTGSIPNLSSNTDLAHFYCNNNQLTGSVPDLSSNTSLTQFNCNNNQLTGSVPDLSSNTSLTQFNCNTNQLTGNIPNLSSNTSLAQLNFYNNELTGSIPDLSSNTSLTHFYCSSNQLTGFTGGTIKVSTSFDASNNLLDITSVDAILQALVDGGTVNATIVLQTGNAIPSNTTAIDTLRTNGCTVTVEGGY